MRVYWNTLAGPAALVIPSASALEWPTDGSRCIAIERIVPGHPEQNGRHDNRARPHQAPAMQVPAEDCVARIQAYSNGFCTIWGQPR